MVSAKGRATERREIRIRSFADLQPDYAVHFRPIQDPKNRIVEELLASCCDRSLEEVRCNIPT